MRFGVVSDEFGIGYVFLNLFNDIVKVLKFNNVVVSEVNVNNNIYELKRFFMYVIRYV